MDAILDAVKSYPTTKLGPRTVLVNEGARTGKLYVLKSGDLDVLHEGSSVASFGEPGDVIGEMSVLLNVPHSATVRTRLGAEVFVIDDPDRFLEDNPRAARHIAKTLAIRLQKTTALLVDVRHQIKERDDSQMLDKIFALLK